MARTPSTMIPLGTAAPDFALTDTLSGNTVRLSDFTGKPALLVMFICNHCPFVKHVRAQLAQLGRDYQPRGVGIVAISANDIGGYPDDNPEMMAIEAREAGYTFPYLYDDSQSVAKAYSAACTPDFFVFNAQRRLVYRGQLDESRPSKYTGRDIPVTGRDLRAALEAALGGRPALTQQYPSLGCNIKWRPGNEPDYAR